MTSVPPREIVKPLPKGTPTRRTSIVCAVDLREGTIPAVPPLCPVVFCTDTLRAVAVLRQAGEEFGMDRRMRRWLQRQLSEGETCVSGWLDGALVSYGWIQYRYRRLARCTKVYLAAHTAFIFRCWTAREFRGKHIYPAALAYALEYLRARGFQKVFIDHDAGNEPSRRGILRAGFSPVGQYAVFGWGPAKFATVPRSLQRVIQGT